MRIGLKKIESCWLAVLLAAVIFLLPRPVLAAVSADSSECEPPQISAAAAVLIDAETGCVLWEQNGYELLPPASTTKILTALVTLDMDVLAEETVISNRAAAVGESSANLQAGEVFTVENLLKGALVKSANDACYAVGEAVAGSEPLFVRWMTMKAQSLGAYDAVLANTNGLPAENHYLSAYDLSLIARADLQNQLFREIVSSQYIKMAGGNYTRTFKNTNKLLFSNEYVIGIKTGTTDAAGACLVSAMAKDGRTVIAVVLNSPDRYGESLKLLNYGIDGFRNVEYLAKGERAGYYPLSSHEGVFAVASGSGCVTVAKGEAEGVTAEYCWADGLHQVGTGDLLGTVVLKKGTEDLQYINLVAESSAGESHGFGFWQKIQNLLKRIFV